MPDHLHCIWTLPPEDGDFSTRWNLLKGHFFRAVEKSERVSESRGKRRERGLWQRRFWAHLITDQVTLTATWIASTGTLSNMAGQSGLPIGRIRAFTTLWNEVFIQLRGGIQGNSNLMQVNDSKDAVHAGLPRSAPCGWLCRAPIRSERIGTCEARSEGRVSGMRRVNRPRHATLSRFARESRAARPWPARSPRCASPCRFVVPQRIL
ncbi:hypothetical protein JOD69_003931 [Methylocaldum sp. RMAD-M]|jgi:hypothetical protein|nr:hypothetical protein [Methylocaldum sp. RMAD-M]